ncbi:RNA polymerase sigma factor [Emticicia sp.]|uniref:RNA polymerase sigma factor n=1 Tax=Emticicia sp. TaxID=1930953 RepID=UPI003752B4E1
MNYSNVNTNIESDILLWQAFKIGDTEAFEQLYHKYFKVLGNYGLRLNPNKDLVEDAIQDVFIDLWRRKEYLNDIENVKYYLFRAVRNQFSRNIQKDIFEGSEDVNNFLDYLGTISLEQESIDVETNQIRTISVRKAMNNLSNRQAEAVHLRFYQGLSLEEIALIMQVQKQVVKNLLSKSYAILKISLKDLISIALFFLFK